MVDFLAPGLLDGAALNIAVLHALDQLGVGVLVKDLSTGRYDLTNAMAAVISNHRIIIFLRVSLDNMSNIAKTNSRANDIHGHV